MYAFFSLKINVEIDEVCRSENVDGTKNAPYLNFCSSKIFLITRTSDYFTSLEKINFYFCSTYVFSYVVIDIKINEVCRLEDVNGIKHASCLNFYFSMTFNMIRTSNYPASSKKSTLTFVPCTLCSLLKSTLKLIRFVDWKMLIEPRVHFV
jgi:hypothetical protein